MNLDNLSMTIYAFSSCSKKADETHAAYCSKLKYGNASKELTGIVTPDNNPTSNRIALIGVIEAIKAIKTPIGHVTIYSNSGYVVDNIRNKRVHSWIKNNYFSNGKEIANRDLWEEFVDVARKSKCYFTFCHEDEHDTEASMAKKTATDIAKRARLNYIKED